MSLNMIYRIKKLEEQVGNLEYTVRILTQKQAPGRPRIGQPPKMICVRCEEVHAGGFENCVEKEETAPQDEAEATPEAVSA